MYCEQQKSLKLWSELNKILHRTKEASLTSHDKSKYFAANFLLTLLIESRMALILLENALVSSAIDPCNVLKDELTPYTTSANTCSNPHKEYLAQSTINHLYHLHIVYHTQLPELGTSCPLDIRTSPTPSCSIAILKHIVLDLLTPLRLYFSHG
jgi:hypothetical protein